MEYDSSIGYVISTPNSKPTAIMGIMDAPMIKQNSDTNQDFPELKLKAAAIVLRTERIDIMIIDSL